MSAPAVEIRALLAACRGSLAAVAVFSLGINLLLLAPSLYMLQVYDRVLVSDSVPTLAMLSLLVLFLFAALGGLEWARAQILVQLTERIDARLGARLFDVSFRQTLAGGHATGAQALHDLQGVRQFLTGPGFFAFFDAPWIPVYLLVLFAFHPWYGWLGVVSALLLLGIAIGNERATAMSLTAAQREAAQSHAAVALALRNAEVIEALGMLANLRERWRRRARNVIALQTSGSRRAALFTVSSKVLRQVLQSALLGVGALLVLRHELSGGLMIAGSIILGRALAPIDQLTGVWKNVIVARDQYRRLNDCLRRVPAAPPRMTLPPPRGELVVENLTVVPPGATAPAIRNVSFRLEPGETLGIVGPSAAGKSSLVRALLGVWPAAHGCVRLDGADVAQCDRGELGRHLGYLPQDVELFAGTVAENIARFGVADPAEVVAAAQLAAVDRLILRLPQGYDTPIGGAPGMPTPGQRQRLALARAVYGGPKVVILDEPNSSLDLEGEAALLATLQALKSAGATIVIVSHRAGILSAAGKLLVLNDGERVDFGPCHEVRARLRDRAEAERRRAPNVVALHSVPGPAS